MKRSELVKNLSEQADMTRAQAARAVDALFGADKGIISRAVQKGDRVHISGLGTFELRRRKSRAPRGVHAGRRRRHAAMASETAGGAVSTTSPNLVAAQLAAEAPDEDWLREVADDLDRQIRVAPLERWLRLWGLSASEAAKAFGVSRQALSKWRRSGIPAERAAAMADFADATDVLDRRVKRERIPAVVRRPAEMLGGRSLYDIACEGRHAEVRDAVIAMFDLRRVQP